MKILFIIAVTIMFIFRPVAKVDTVVPVESPRTVQAHTAVSSPATGLTALAEIPNDQEWAVIAKYKNAPVIAQIYKGESSFGQFDECRRRGIGFNGFGMLESVKRLTTIGPYCFDTFDDVVKEVDAWIEREHAKGTSYSMMNCYYVTGHRVESCNTSYKLADISKP